MTEHERQKAANAQRAASSKRLLLNPERFETILNSISDGIFAVDLDFRICCFNRAAQEMTGFSTEEALGERCHKIFHSVICQDSCALRYTLEKGHPIVGLEVTIVRKSGEIIPVSISTALLKDHQDHVIGCVESFRDLRLVETLRKEIEKQYTFSDIISKSAAMQRIFDILPTIATGQSTVLIEGESGTGKELFARAIHRHSPRGKRPMITVNCGAIPENLLEAELFGYKAGAFTDAKKDKPGQIALAENGTLFLDEVGDLPPILQVKLLRFLQEKTYMPLGGIQPLKANVRIISATNRRLEDLVAQDKFRSDFFYRINVMKVEIPPLRHRLEDVPLLANHFLARFSSLRGKPVNRISPAALKPLLSHTYPGNVRELENIIEHAYVLCSGQTVLPEHLPDWLHRHASDSPHPPESLKDAEKQHIERVLAANGWNREAAADELGVHITTLYRKVKRLGIEMEPPPTDPRTS